MNLIKEPKDYIWILPFIGGILILISIFTPAYYASIYSVTEYYWMWGLDYYSVSGYGSQTTFIPFEEPYLYTIPMFLAGLIPLLLILAGSLALIISANAVRTSRADIKHRENLWIAMGIILIVAPIIFIVGIDITTINYLEYLMGPAPSGYNLWDVYDPGFAVIAPFIGAALSIAGSIASKVIKQREAPIFKKQIEGGVITKTPIGQTSKKINFCSECGHQLLYDGSRFCTNCGKELKI
ncbi:MAG: zinc ribbon domain-containing protein [Promethearchaeota archaeon]